MPKIAKPIFLQNGFVYLAYESLVDLGFQNYQNEKKNL